jgi:hypothetical protein
VNRQTEHYNYDNLFWVKEPAFRLSGRNTCFDIVTIKIVDIPNKRYNTSTTKAS